MLFDRTFLIGVVVGFGLCYAVHHFAPGKAGLMHGKTGGSY